MSDMELSGTWTGHFTYNVDEHNVFFGIQTPITLSLTSIDGTIEGTCYDEEYASLVKERILVRGFEEEGFISLMVKYPFYCFKDQDRKMHIDYQFPHPDKHFSGTYDQVNQVLHGIWEMEMVIATEEETDQLVLFSGEWEIRKQV